jgi:hypothetical protein
VVRLEFERERINQGIVYDQMSINYASKTEFHVTTGQGSSPEIAGVEKMKYSVLFEDQPPEPTEFEVSSYPVVEGANRPARDDQ